MVIQTELFISAKISAESALEQEVLRVETMSVVWRACAV